MESESTGLSSHDALQVKDIANLSENGFEAVVARAAGVADVEPGEFRVCCCDVNVTVNRLKVLHCFQEQFFKSIDHIRVLQTVELAAIDRNLSDRRHH